MMPAANTSARVEPLAARVLGAHVPGLADDGLLAQILDERVGAGDPEVADLHLALEAQEHVGGRDVAVHEAEARAVVAAGAVRIVEPP